MWMVKNVNVRRAIEKRFAISMLGNALVILVDLTQGHRNKQNKHNHGPTNFK